MGYYSKFIPFRYRSSSLLELLYSDTNQYIQKPYVVKLKNGDIILGIYSNMIDESIQERVVNAYNHTIERPYFQPLTFIFESCYNITCIPEKIKWRELQIKVHDIDEVLYPTHEQMMILRGHFDIEKCISERFI